MEIFTHIKVIITIILGLGITHLLKGTVKFIQHPKEEKPYWIHLLWVLYVFFLLVLFWWWEYGLTGLEHWSFSSYFFLIIYTITFYIICALLFPDDIKDYKGYEDYFFSRKNWLFSVLAISYVLDIGDTLIKGKVHYQSLHFEYPLRNILHIALCLIAIRTNNKTYHAIMVMLFLVYQFSWLVRLLYGALIN